LIRVETFHSFFYVLGVSRGEEAIKGHLAKDDRKSGGYMEWTMSMERSAIRNERREHLAEGLPVLPEAKGRDELQSRLDTIEKSLDQIVALVVVLKHQSEMLIEGFLQRMQIAIETPFILRRCLNR
jgi:hypothetical protein